MLKDNAMTDDQVQETAMPEPPEPPAPPLDYEACVEIKLTPQQRAVVKKETGRDMDVLILSDEDGFITHGMSRSKPDDFTVIAIRQAARLNEYEADYHQYLVELDQWQKNLGSPDPLDAVAEKAEIAAMQEAERLRLFFEAETDACVEAREIAKMVWGKKN